jgi:uncharacterized protein (DUF433 family)
MPPKKLSTSGAGAAGPLARPAVIVSLAEYHAQRRDFVGQQPCRFMVDAFLDRHGHAQQQAAAAVAYNRDGAMKFTRITARPAVCTGKPCIRDLRFPVSRLLGLLAARQTPEQILTAYPYLEAADIDEALRYAASLAEDETIELVG